MAVGTLLLMALPAQAQRIEDSRLAAVPVSEAPTATLTFQQAQGEKSGAVAGVLSFVIPGVGSYYAGNNKHGHIHLGVHIGTFVVMMAGAASAFEDCTSLSSDPTCGEGGAGLFVVGWLGMLTNGVWSIFTAVGDARAFNSKGAARPSRVGEAFAPEIKNVRDVQLSPLSHETDNRVGLQLVKLKF